MQPLHTQKSYNLSMHQITQPLFFKSRDLSTKKKHLTSSQEQHTTSAQNNHATSPQNIARKPKPKRYPENITLVVKRVKLLLPKVLQK